MSEYICNTDDRCSMCEMYKTAEPIIRCRDCRHYREHAFIMVADISDVCLFWHGTPTKVEPNGFCAWGERLDA